MLEHSPGFTPLMLATKVAYSLNDKYIRLKQVYSADQDLRTHDSIGFDENDDPGDIESGDTDTNETTENEENDISLRVNVQGMENIFDFDHEVDGTNEVEKPEKTRKRVNVRPLHGPEFIDEIPAKRNRKSVKDGKYSEFSCINVATDVANQDITIKDSVHKRVRKSGANLKKSAEHFDKLMEGSGYKYPCFNGSLQSLDNSAPVNTTVRKKKKTVKRAAASKRGQEKERRPVRGANRRR
ncbi:hypothetical protein QAD02_013277 [Eretmocerus hayati]|uniref:Uncharacterized protein n=1 Tax=Eretmocerus hayati TaxID=131215 RepID=A0ACC2P6S2_9HYME|nr:hypothetical protein QAD02_013277 [Eretmocerus hayati]